MTPFVLKRVNELTKGRSLQASIHFFLLDLYCLNTIILLLNNTISIQDPQCHMIMDVQCTCSISMQLLKERSWFNFRGNSLLYLNFKTLSSTVHLALLPMGIWWYSTSTKWPFKCPGNPFNFTSPTGDV